MMSVGLCLDPYGFSGPSGASMALMGIGGGLMGLFVLAVTRALHRRLMAPVA
jgi:hypothetical protein